MGLYSDDEVIAFPHKIKQNTRLMLDQHWAGEVGVSLISREYQIFSDILLLTRRYRNIHYSVSVVTVAVFIFHAL